MEWKPIATAPKDGRRILVYRSDEDEACQVVWSETLKVWLYKGTFGISKNVTHWMPMPAAPVKIEEEI